MSDIWRAHPPCSSASPLGMFKLSWVIVFFRGLLSAQQDCCIATREPSFLRCEAEMTMPAMFHSDLSISVNKCIAMLPQTVTRSSGEHARTHTHTHTRTHALDLVSQPLCTDAHKRHAGILWIFCSDRPTRHLLV